MPLFKSFRSKGRRSSSISSSVAASEAEKPASIANAAAASSTTTASRKERSNQGSLRRPPSSAKMAKALSSNNAGSATTNNNDRMDAVPSTPKSNLANADANATKDSAAPSSGAAGMPPRPSELFAGKGVQWDSINLSSPASVRSQSTAATPGSSNNGDDLQNFLKARRQWVPTFVTEDPTGEGEANARRLASTDLSSLTFGTTLPPSDASLKSLKELEESHRRKEKLLGEKRLGGSLFDDGKAETSAAGAAAAAAAAAATSPGGLQRPASVAMNSFGSGKGVTDYSRIGNGTSARNGVARTSAAAGANAPSRSASSGGQKGDKAGGTGGGTAANAAAGAASGDPTKLNPGTGAETAAPAAAGGGSTRDSHEQSAGFVTPNEAGASGRPSLNVAAPPPTGSTVTRTTITTTTTTPAAPPQPQQQGVPSYPGSAQAQPAK